MNAGAALCLWAQKGACPQPTLSRQLPGRALGGAGVAASEHRDAGERPFGRWSGVTEASDCIGPPERRQEWG